MQKKKGKLKNYKDSFNELLIYSIIAMYII